ncbi:MAG: PEP-CTERM system histidine kinase PrsK [Burkholderiaceae bacterium]|nr:PEP-CTERM system histidine kinase PrsK [Burkholderiaceae bacterium]
MSLAAYSHALAAVAYSIFAISLLRGGLAQTNNTAAQLSFTAAVFISAAWALASLAAQLTGNVPLAIGGGLLDLARYAAWLVFAFMLLRPAGPRQRSRSIMLISLGAIAVVAIGVLVTAGALGIARPGGLARNVPLASLALPVLGLVLVEQLFRNAAEASRWHTKPLCLGLACIFLFDIYLHSNVLLFGRFDADSVTIRSAVHAVPVALLYIATKRHADWSGSFQVSRDAAFHTATLMLVGAYLLVISAIGYYVRYVGGDWGGALALALLCVALVLLALLLFSGTLRAKLKVFVGKNFFRYRYDYRNEWLRFTSRLAADSSPREVGGLVVRGLAEILHSPAGALWYRDTNGAHLIQAARWNAPRSSASEPVDSPFARFLHEREWVVDLDEYRAHPDRYAGAQPPAWLADNAQHWLALPLIVADQLTGIVVVERPHAALRVDWEVRDLLKTAGRQAASFLALMHATDALLEARKFEAFNKMSAFVVHDLKNIVAQLSLMMQNARRLKDNAEFQEDMLTTVENSLDRMRRLMLQLRSGETPAGVSSGVILPPIVERIRAAAFARGRAIEVQVIDPVVTRGHAERVERVLGHLVDNALDATQPTDKIVLTLAREGSHAKIVIRDTGQGMSPEFLNNRLFKPFSSTKVNGMGIGAFESRQYIQEIGGSLAVESELGQGTVVTVLLPLMDSARHGEPELYSAK